MFFLISLYHIIRPQKPQPTEPTEPQEPPEPQPRYKFKFKKRGLQGNEFEDCLTSKVDKLLEHINIERIKTLKSKTITAVRREICIRENLSKQELDQRNQTAISNYLPRRPDSESQSDSNAFFSDSDRREGRILRGETDTPMRHNDVPVPRGGRRLDKLWNQIYHEEQYNLFANHLLTIEELRNLLPGIEVDPHRNRRGYLIRRIGVSRNELNCIEFCNVIDEISVVFFKKLRELSLPGFRGETFRQQWEETLKSVFESCKTILLYRNAVDWCTDNDLMSGNYNVWKEHLMVMISFSALMVVTKMLCIKLDIPP